jgi:hypothetical protein
MSDRPDFERRTDISNQTVGSLAVEVAAQTINQLGVDVEAQSVGDLEIDLAAQSLGDLEVDLSSQSIQEVAVDLAAQSISNLGVDIESQSTGDIAVDLATQSLSNLGVDIQSQSAGDLSVDLSSQSINNLGVDIQAQTVSDIGIDIQDQTVAQLDTAVQSEPGLEVVKIDKDRTANLPDLSDDAVTFTPPPDTVFENLSVFAQALTTGGGGNHAIKVSVTGTNDLLAVQGAFPGTNTIELALNTFFAPGNAINLFPDNPQSRIANIQGLIVDENNPLEIRYQNRTGQANTATRDYSLFATRRDIA